MPQLIRDGRLWLAVAGLVCALLYWPGLHGGYLFDDFPNIVANPDVQVGPHPHLSDWVHAAWSSHTDLKRPLAMLSFAVNIYLGGLNPFGMKLANLGIHLANGLLLYLVAVELLRWNDHRATVPADPAANRRVAALITAAWLLLPIDVSSVLYVVQRMENLAQLFVLGGLLIYLRWRNPQRATPRAPWLAFAVLLPFTAMGLLSKETAALLPVYALLAEFALLRFESREGTSRSLIVLYTGLVILPGLIATAWIIKHDFNAATYAGRPFTPEQRLLTEGRIVCHYIEWILLPAPDTLSFYHDDLAISKGWLAPPSTLLCTALLTALLGLAVWQRSRRPLVTLGLLWFFAAHLLTATFIPLELVFEHRNYFASIGVLLAVTGFLLPLLKTERRAAIAVVTAGLVFYSFLTAMRARDWSDPLQLAHAEVDAHPQSPRANYELGRMLVIASNYNPDSPLLRQAITVLEHNSRLPDASILPTAALILVANRAHLPIDPQWWHSIIQKLGSERAISVEDVTALQDLARCQVEGGDCRVQIPEMMEAFFAALSHPAPSTILLMTYGDYVTEHLGDYELAERTIRQAIAQSPGEVEIQLELVKILMLDGRKADTAPVVARLQTENLTPEQVDKLNRLLQLPPAQPRAAAPHTVH